MNFSSSSVLLFCKYVFLGYGDSMVYIIMSLFTLKLFCVFFGHLTTTTVLMNTCFDISDGPMLIIFSLGTLKVFSFFNPNNFMNWC